MVDSSALPARSPQARLCGSLFGVLSQDMRYNTLSLWGPKRGFGVEGKILRIEKVCVPFLPLRTSVGCTPRGSCNNTLLRMVLRRFYRVLCRRFLEGFLKGLVVELAGGGVLRRAL